MSRKGESLGYGHSAKSPVLDILVYFLSITNWFLFLPKFSWLKLIFVKICPVIKLWNYYLYYMTCPLTCLQGISWNRLISVQVDNILPPNQLIVTYHVAMEMWCGKQASDRGFVNYVMLCKHTSLNPIDITMDS